MISRLQTLFQSLQEEPGAPPPGLVLRTGASFLAGLYGLGAQARRAFFDRGWRQPRRLPAPVLSIGNLVVGGVGKTPLTAWLARYYQQTGRRVAILSRGYGGQAQGIKIISDGERIFLSPPQAGEEAYLLALRLPGTPVVTGSDRYAAGLQAWKAFRPDLFLLDDGFQHFQLHRDLDVVLLDAARPFGNGRLLPRGPLREPRHTLQRPLLLVLTRYDTSRHEEIYAALGAAFPTATIIRATFQLSHATVHPGSRNVPLQEVAALNLAALSGLARPQVFAASLQDHGIAIKKHFIFPDHHVYSRQDLDQVAAVVRAQSLDGLLTTEKDWVKLDRNWSAAIPLYVLHLEVTLLDPWPEHLLALPGTGQTAR